jgi:hypothetical protein
MTDNANSAVMWRVNYHAPRSRLEKYGSVLVLAERADEAIRQTIGMTLALKLGKVKIISAEVEP